MAKMVNTVKEALVELEVNGACRFHKGYISNTEWKTSYAPALREAFPDCWWIVNSSNHLIVTAK